MKSWGRGGAEDTISGEDLLGVSPGKRRLGDIPIEIGQASEAMSVLDGADRLDVIPVDVVRQLSPERFGIIEARDGADVAILGRAGSVHVTDFHIAQPGPIAASFAFAPCSPGNGDFENDIVRLGIVRHDGRAEGALRVEVERQGSPQGIQRLRRANYVVSAETRWSPPGRHVKSEGSVFVARRYMHCVSLLSLVQTCSL